MSVIEGDGSVGLATGYGLDLLHSGQTGSGAHPASYGMGIGDPLPEDKTAGT
jgi:hypothetical protein